MVTTIWWTCLECGADVELPGRESTDFQLGCPDCAGPMAEQWRWDTAA